MQGYILRVQKVRDEDLLVFVLTPNLLVKSYRFFGARHSNIMTGYKIDFELEQEAKFLPKLRSILHLGFKWLLERDKLIIWQQFMRLLYDHLKEVEQLDEIYFFELDRCAKQMQLQNPKRLIIESYVKILEYEGRLHSELECFICDEEIESELCLTRGFLPSHKHCLDRSEFDASKIKNLFDTKSTIELNDYEINRLYKILLDGL